MPCYEMTSAIPNKSVIPRKVDLEVSSQNSIYDENYQQGVVKQRESIKKFIRSRKMLLSRSSILIKLVLWKASLASQLISLLCRLKLLLEQISNRAIVVCSMIEMKYYCKFR